MRCTRSRKWGENGTCRASSSRRHQLSIR
jgi:hypothetical protein